MTRGSSMMRQIFRRGTPYGGNDNTKKADPGPYFSESRWLSQMS